MTHNRPDDLRHCLDSVGGAIIGAGSDVEVVVAVDPSPSDLRNQTVMLEARERFPGIEFRSVYNGLSKGQSGNTNTGLLHARGRYVHILHDDDQLLPTYLELVFPHLVVDRYPVLHLSGPWDQTGCEDASPLSLRSARWYATQFLPLGTVVPSLGVFRRTYSRALLFDERLQFVCDWDFFARHLLEAHARQQMVAKVQQPAVAYRQTTSSITGSIRGELLHHFEHMVLVRKMQTSLRLFSLLHFTPDERVTFISVTNDYRRARTTRFLAREPALSLHRGPFDSDIDAVAAEVAGKNPLLLADSEEQAAALKGQCRSLARWRIRRRVFARVWRRRVA